MTYNDFTARYRHNPNKPFKSGGQGSIFVGEDTQNGRKIAIKRGEVTKDHMRYSIKDEFELAKKLKHRNLLDYHDVYRIKTRMGTFDYGIMEFIENGTNLEEYVGKYYPNEMILKKLLLDILYGLKYLHQNKIIHRDLKPSNILIKNVSTKEPIAKIIDFGVSKKLTKKDPTSSVIPGTVYYMSPEQISGDKLQYNSDLWSFGVIVYKLFTDNLPFDLETGSTSSQEQAIPKILKAQLSKKSLKAIAHPYNIAIERCLIKDSSQRVQSTQELIDIILSPAQPPTQPPTQPPVPPPRADAPLNHTIRQVVISFFVILLLGLSANYSPFANHRMGVILESSTSIDADSVHALEMYQYAAENGYADAQYRMGDIYLKGQIRQEVNRQKAFQWFSEAASQDHSRANYNLGYMYEKAIGVDQNFQKSFIHYEKAAYDDIPEAQNSLAKFYTNGISVETNFIQARRWLRKAANQNFENAQRNLGVSFENGGEGITTNLDSAYYWFHKADRGTGKYTKDLERILKKQGRK